MKDTETARDYANMSLAELIETIIRDAMRAGSLNYPLRTAGYHSCSNLTNTDRL